MDHGIIVGIFIYQEMLISNVDAAKRLAMSTQTIDRMVKAGRLSAVRLGNRRVGIRQSSVDAIIQVHNQKGIK